MKSTTAGGTNSPVKPPATASNSPAFSSLSASRTKCSSSFVFSVERRIQRVGEL